jgi:hypothetical protein
VCRRPSPYSLCAGKMRKKICRCLIRGPITAYQWAAMSVTEGGPQADNSATYLSNKEEVLTWPQRLSKFCIVANLFVKDVSIARGFLFKIICFCFCAPYTIRTALASLSYQSVQELAPQDVHSVGRRSYFTMPFMKNMCGRMKAVSSRFPSSCGLEFRVTAP